MKEKTKKEICLKIEDFNSVLNENQLEIYKNQVSKLDNKEKMKIDSFEYWETYKLGVEYIIKILNDNDKSIKILEDQIIRCESRKDNYSKIFSLISLITSILTASLSLSNISLSTKIIIVFLFMVLLCLAIYTIESKIFLKDNYKIHIFENKIIELKKNLTINSKILTK